MTEPTILDELTPAMMTMETDVELPSGVRPNSIMGNLIALKPGEVYIYAQELPADKPVGELQREAADLRYRMRNAVVSTIRNAKRVSPLHFSLETAMVMYPTGRTFIQVAIKASEPDASAGPDDNEV